MSQARILIVDDHRIVCEGLCRMLQEQPDMAVIGVAANARSAMDQIRARSPDVVIMDMYLGEEYGIQVSQQILAEFPGIRIVVLSVESNQTVVIEALQAGVLGYVTKADDTSELVRAIRSVMDGRTYLCPELASSIVAAYMKAVADQTIPSSNPELATGELNLLKLIAEGKRNKEIARVLDAGTKTVATRRLRLMKKLGCSSSSELTRYAIREGLMKP
jgi:DNA-binding NarL/FixJ family response regulator